MTKAELFKLVKAMNLRISFIADTGEYRIAFMSNSEKSAYYATDRQDALDTATAMNTWESERTSAQRIALAVRQAS